MTQTAPHRTAPTDWNDPERAVVVAVDGSERNRSAVAYATREAVRAGRPLTLLAVLDDYTIPIPHHGTGGDDEHQWQLLNALRTTILRDHPGTDVRRDVQCGGTVPTLLDRSVEQGVLVVGKRGLGTFGRLMVGSTSIAVAGRSRVPVVIVPDGWDQDGHQDAPVVVGVRANDPDLGVLRYAFAAAASRGVPLHVVHAVHIDPLLVWDPALDAPAYRVRADRASAQLEEVLAPLRQEHPAVDATVVESSGHPAGVLLERSADAQLLVLGRQHEGHVGFTLGSVARAVLHYAEIPVAVVPPTEQIGDGR